MVLDKKDHEILNATYKKAENDIISLEDIDEIINIFKNKNLLTKERFNELVFHGNGYADSDSFFVRYKKTIGDSEKSLSLKIPQVLGAIKGVITGIKSRSAEDEKWLEMRTSLKKELKEELLQEILVELKKQ